MAPLALLPAPAWACGGFFCNNVDPIVQSAERILFRVEPGGDVTTFVEIQFQGPPAAFGWVLPVPTAFNPDTDVSLAPAGLFDGLEARTAPIFTDASEDGTAYETGSACGCGDGAFGEGVIATPDVSGVEVVGSAVVGPYAIELITAEDGGNLTNWLLLNGYQVPLTAAEPIQHYLDQGMAFAGFKLESPVAGGPIDTLVLGCAQDMDIVAYVLAEETYVAGNYAATEFDWSSVTFTGDGTTDDETRAIASTTGQAFITEFAGDAGPVLQALDEDSIMALGSGLRLTRFRSFMSPTEMTLDPVFSADPSAPDVDNHHEVGEAEDTAAAAVAAPLLLLGGLFGAMRRRVGPS